MDDTVAEVLRGIVSFAAPERPVDDVVDEIQALHLFARRNEVSPGLSDSLGDAVDLGAQILSLVIYSEANRRSVGHNFKAMVYATVDHAFIDIALAKAHADPFTLLTTAASFILTRLSEYAYVEAAKETEGSRLHATGHEVARAMWNALARNPQTVGLSWERCQQYRSLVRQTRELLDAAQTPEPVIQFLTLLFFVRLLEALQIAEGARV